MTIAAPTKTRSERRGTRLRYGFMPIATSIVAAVEHLQIERANGVVTLTLNRPEKKNAATVEMFQDLAALLTDIAHRPDDRAVVLTGAGGNFCSGVDLWGDPGVRAVEVPMLTRMRQLGEAAIALQRMPLPVIAKVRGVAAGAGMSLALGCDLVLAARDARFSMIFAQRGLSLDLGASWLLPRQIGLHRAKELALFGDVLSAADVHAMGLLNRVVDDDQLDLLTAEWAQRLATGPSLALAQSKFLLNDSMAMSLTQAIDAEGAAQTVSSVTADCAEGLRAFVQRRPPQFQGR